jgi:hypothetical protein
MSSWRTLDQIERLMVGVVYQVDAEKLSATQVAKELARPATKEFEPIFDDQDKRISFSLGELLALMQDRGWLDYQKINGGLRYLMRFTGESEPEYGDRKAVESMLWAGKETLEGQALILAWGYGGASGWLSPGFQSIHPYDFQALMDTYEVETRLEIPAQGAIKLWCELGLINRQGKVPARIQSKLRDVIVLGKVEGYTSAKEWQDRHDQDLDLAEVNAQLEAIEIQKAQLLEKKQKRERELL